MADLRLPVRVTTPHPCLFVDADAATIGEIFGGLAADDQAIVLREMMAALWSEGIQRDYTAIELAKPEFAEARERLLYLCSAEGV